MGRFRRWGSILAQATGKSVFVQMHETGVPIPVDPRVYFRWAEAQEKPGRYRLMAFFRTFTLSERYSKAVMADGANYHDLDGNVTRPVGPASVESARKNLEIIAGWKRHNAKARLLSLADHQKEKADGQKAAQ